MKIDRRRFLKMGGVSLWSPGLLQGQLRFICEGNVVREAF